MKKLSVPLSFRTTISYHLTHVRMVTVKTSTESKLRRGCRYKGPLLRAAEDVNGKSHDGGQGRGSLSNDTENEMGGFPHTLYQKQRQIIKSVKCRHGS